MIEINGNILNVKQGFVCNPVGTKGMMNYGRAQSIATLWPNVLRDYMSARNLNKLHLGEVVFTTIRVSSLYVATLIAQNDHEVFAKRRRINYPALSRCLNKVQDWCRCVSCGKLPMYIPYGIGCDSTAGGDWEIVRTIIKRESPKAIIVRAK